MGGNMKCMVITMVLAALLFTAYVQAKAHGILFHFCIAAKRISPWAIMKQFDDKDIEISNREDS
jgi:hypothetical protein